MESLSGWGRNVRAALTLAGRDLDWAASELNISRKTLQRTMRGGRAPRDWETRRLSELLEVPVAFLENGLAGVMGAPADPLVERLDKIEALITGVAADVGEIKQREEWAAAAKAPAH